MLNLNEREIKAIVKVINDNFDEYYSKYSSSKYPEKPYIEWKKIFPDPKNVSAENIKQALEWKYGHWGKKDYVRAHKSIILKVQENWSEFAKLDNYEIESIFSFWSEKLSEHQNFITIAYLSHLICNSTIPIIDQHTHFEP